MTFSHEQKLSRALEHLESYNSISAVWVNLHLEALPFELQLQARGDVSHYVVTWNPIQDFPAIQLGLLVGDFLHNLRTALDHLVYELALAYTKTIPPAVVESSEFPIFWLRPMNPDEEGRKIGCIHPGAQTLIKSIQPHHRGTNYRENPLWILHELERIDKHRTLHIVSHELAQNDIGGENVRVVSFNGMDLGDRLERGAKVAEFEVACLDPRKPMQVKYSPSTRVTLEKGLPLSGHPLGTALRDLHAQVKSVAIVPLEAFL